MKIFVANGLLNGELKNMSDPPYKTFFGKSLYGGLLIFFKNQEIKCRLQPFSVRENYIIFGEKNQEICGILFAYLILNKRGSLCF